MLYIIKLNFKIINAKFVRNVDETFYFILFYLICWVVDGNPLRRICMNFNLIITLWLYLPTHVISDLSLYVITFLFWCFTSFTSHTVSYHHIFLTAHVRDSSHFLFFFFFLISPYYQCFLYFLLLFRIFFIIFFFFLTLDPYQNFNSKFLHRHCYFLL